MKNDSEYSTDDFDSEDTLVHDEIENQQDESFIEERKELVEELFEKTEAYLKTNINLIKLKAVDKVAAAASGLVANLAVVILSVFFLIMLNIAIAIWIGNTMENMQAGFFIVAGFYGVLTLLFVMFGKSMVKKTIGSSIISDLIK